MTKTLLLQSFYLCWSTIFGGDKMKVIFRKDKKTGEVMAFFPETYKDGIITCYAHNGQHSTAELTFYWTTIKAKPLEYKELEKELMELGYQLDIKQKFIR